MCVVPCRFNNSVVLRRSRCGCATASLDASQHCWLQLLIVCILVNKYSLLCGSLPVPDEESDLLAMTFTAVIVLISDQTLHARGGGPLSVGSLGDVT